MSLVPWAVAFITLIGLAFWIRRRHASLEPPDLQ
jgi:hypothetical protein